MKKKKQLKNGNGNGKDHDEVTEMLQNALNTYRNARILCIQKTRRTIHDSIAPMKKNFST